MNIKNILVAFAAISFIISNVHAISSITIAYSTEKKKYELIESFFLNREPHSCTRNLDGNMIILIHDKNNNKTITSAKELAQQINTPLTVYDISFCPSSSNNISKDFYILRSDFIRDEKKYDGLEDYCNDYATFVEEYMTQQQTTNESKKQ